ncbi:DUF6686 family protein [Neolewinella agarilytica]|uniref:Uncharacterized protein n=1 Tax=Neolewinella agarilytica TaxID=478744 RepID=A0A1H9NE61_9BACT|nr:DUF6686 family protein [Neolewinella agarilytica]SER34202.1 hypothetical protein SAMN05444359_13618 [Neolewinella agarilytica]
MAHHDHQATILHKDQYGYLVYCPKCYGFQIAYGTFFLNQSLEDMESFTSTVNRYYHKYGLRKDRKRRDVYLETPYAGFGILLSSEDLERLNTMLQNGLLIVQARDRISQQ